MPFGAQVADDGVTRFRLWAPGARDVGLELGGSFATRSMPMAAGGDGWFEASTAVAPAGTRYAFRIDGKVVVPDPASRANPDDVHGPSMVIDPHAYEWQDGDWRGRPWAHAVIYELHVGSFTREGTFAGVIAHLDYLVDLGITAMELMPVAAFPGMRNWGYDGVLPFAPDATYGTPDDLKCLVDAAHARGLMVLLDVVYNHFGPDGNYLHAYAPAFFNAAHDTPWGAAINFDGPHSRTVRDFFIHNALYWLVEFHADGLRLDAVDAIADDSRPNILTELTETVRRQMPPERNVHLVVENDRNDTRHLERDAALRPQAASAQWNDDVHHALHALITGEADGYYADYADQPLAHLGRGLAEGFIQQRDWSGFRNHYRGAPSAHLTPLAFINFLQNHDQVGNRAFGERITAIAPADAVRAAVACVLLAPSPPLLFMGEEFAASTPFLFFCNFGPELAAAVTHGRREAFARLARFADPALRERIPDPNAASTFAASHLNWDEIGQADHRAWLDFYRRCLDVRREHLMPRLAAMQGGTGRHRVIGKAVLAVDWTLGDSAQWALRANFSADAADVDDAPPDQIVFACIDCEPVSERLPPWGVRVTLAPAGIRLASA